MISCFNLIYVTASLQLKCDKREIRAYTGDEFVIVCKYDHARFLFSKKYWCRGESRNTCEILRDTDDVAKTQSTNRVSIIDRHRAGLSVKVTNLQTEDSDFYWIGIDKIYADIMVSVKVIVTEVSKPSVWPLTPLLDGPTCRGKPVTIRCGAPKGSGVFYAWYQQMHH
uniref:Immunoglobulin V-set domain-containing protein n=1 Tax=Cyprinodon variegatus TaxID=28743 RepID=A0A3Q2DZQ4_CYPVA